MNSNPRRKRLLVLGAFVLFILAGWLGMEWWLAKPVEGDFSAEVARLTGDVPEAPVTVARRDGSVKLAIGPLGLTGREGDGAVADLLVAELSEDTGFQLVERRDFARIMQEFELGAAGAIKPADAVKLGRLLGAEWFLLGSAYRSGTNVSAVVRLVDAGSGIVRDLLVLRGDGSPVDAAGSLAALLRRQRSGAESAGKLPEFVAVGGFEDLSVRPRHAGVEAELRNHLTATLAAGPMIVLERELTRLLLEEIRLQQAGLIESTNPPPRVQSTFWLVDGFWQSFDSVGDEIDLTLRVSRIGGAVGRKNLRANRGAALETAVVSAMQELIRDAPEPVQAATRKGEIRAQLAKGMERARLTDTDLEPARWYVRLRFNRGTDYQERLRRREDLIAAVSVFETVLLLDPDHADAKLFLARCLVDPVVGRPDEARGVWRELTGSTKGDVVRLAHSSLVYSYMMTREPQRAVETARAAMGRARNDTHKRLFEELLKTAEFVLPEPELPEAAAHSAAEAELLSSVRSWREGVARGQLFPDRSEFYDFVNYRHADKAEGQKRLTELLPRLIAAAPELEAYLLARAFSCSMPDPSLSSRFETSLETAAASPERILSPELYFEELDSSLLWAIETKQGTVAAKVSDAIMKARGTGVAVNLSDTRLVRHGLALSMAARWRDALRPLDEVSRQVVAMDFVDPLDRYPAYLVPANLIRDCHRELGKTAPVDPSRFETGKPFLSFEEAVAFSPEAGRLWVAFGDRIVEHHTAAGTVVTHRFDPSGKKIATALATSTDSIWVGTSAGLLRLHKATGRLQRYTTVEGLLFDEVSALHLSGNQLWIGYQHASQGGLSVMEVGTGKIQTLTPALPVERTSDGRNESNTAPQRPVRSIASGSGEEIWAGVAGWGLLRFEVQRGIWSTLLRSEELQRVESVVASRDWVAAGVGPRAVSKKHMPLGLWRGASREPVALEWGAILPYPAVTALALDGNCLWIGGPAYLIAFDLDARRIVRHCLMDNTTVHNLATSGDDVWVRLNRAVHRFPRSLGTTTR